MAWFRNYYECYRCDETWQDEWSSVVDDECGACGARHVSAVDTDDLTFIVDKEENCFVVLKSPDTAEHDPDYEEVIRFLRNDFAEAYAEAASVEALV